jgi:hypothetical protein
MRLSSGLLVYSRFDVFIVVLVSYCIPALVVVFIPLRQAAFSFILDSRLCELRTWEYDLTFVSCPYN